MIGLGDLPGGIFGSLASGVSSDGTTVVGSGSRGSGPEAFRWTASEGMVGLGDLPGGGSRSYAYGVSGDGATVVGQGRTSVSTIDVDEAFIWDESHGMRRIIDLLTEGGIDMSGWRLEVATGVSADGRVIVGGGRNGNAFGRTEAWLVDLGPLAVPEPTAFAMWAVALSVSAGFRRGDVIRASRTAS